MISSINVMMTGDLHTFFCVSKKNLKMFSCPSDGARLQYRMEHAENAAACASWSEEALPASHIGCGLPTGWDQPSDERNKVPIFGYSKKWFVYHQILAKSHGKSKHHDFFLENIMSFFGESEINSFLIKKYFLVKHRVIFGHMFSLNLWNNSSQKQRWKKRAHQGNSFSSAQAMRRSISWNLAKVPSHQ